MISLIIGVYGSLGIFGTSVMIASISATRPHTLACRSSAFVSKETDLTVYVWDYQQIQFEFNLAINCSYIIEHTL